MSLKVEKLKVTIQKKEILHGINFEVKQGEFVSLLGPSGCGKTTLLKSIAGLVEVQEGEVWIQGEKATNILPEKRGTIIVFQDLRLFPNMTVEKNIAFPMEIAGVKKDERKKKVAELLAAVQLSGFEKRRIREMSGGQMQRVALARAIVLEPKILCLDEPLSNLDAKLRIDMRMELKRLQKELGITTLYVTHDQEEALTLSDRIAVFNNGYVEQVGTPYEIYNESKSEFVCDFIGDINRLKGELLSEVNTQSGANLDTNKTGFVRIERCISEEKAGYVKLTGKVEEAEFSGVLTKYVLECHGQELKYLEKNDGRRLYQENEQIDLYINPQDIMQF